MVQLYHEDKFDTGLVDLDNNALSKTIGKEVFNIARVLESTSENVAVGDLVSLSDELLEPIPDGSKGFNQQTGAPHAGYMALGKLISFMYISDKIGQAENQLLFILPESFLAVKHNV